MKLFKQDPRRVYHLEDLFTLSGVFHPVCFKIPAEPNIEILFYTMKIGKEMISPDSIYCVLKNRCFIRACREMSIFS